MNKTYQIRMTQSIEIEIEAESEAEALKHYKLISEWRRTEPTITIDQLETRND